MTNTNDPRIKALAPLLQRVRRDVTAIKKPDGTTGWTREPLTKELVAKHLNGGPARGVCPIKEGESLTLMGLLDFDSHGGETPWDGMVAAVSEVHAAAALFGLQGVAFRSSGGRGVHLMFLWAEPQDAAAVRAMLTDILAACGFANGTKGVGLGQVEVFPKQDRVDVGGYGNQFILPLAGKSAPLDPLFGFEPMPHEFLTAKSWVMSEPVPAREQPAAAPAGPAGAGVGAVGADIPVAVLRSALAAIPNEGDDAPGYDEWRDIIFGVHHATRGSAEGLALAIEFSARNAEVHDEKFLRERVWPYIKHKAGGKTGRSVLAAARIKAQWEQQGADWFEDLTGSEPAAKTLSEKPGGSASTNHKGIVGLSDPSIAIEPDALPGFQRDKQNRVEVTAPNLNVAVSRPDICGGMIGYDTFRDEVMIDRSMTGKQWQSFADGDYFWMRVRLESFPGASFKVIGREAIRDAVHAVAERNKFDSATLWLEGLEWDGVERIDAFLPTYFRSSDTAYTRAVSTYLWTALAGRLMHPGVKADMVPIAVGLQGVGKSTAVSAIAPGVEFFAEISFAESEDDMARKLRGKVVAEIGELRGLHSKEIESIKAFVSRTNEQWVPKFKEFSTQYARRCVFIGTTNQSQFLADDTGNRRWLPFEAAAHGPVDVAAIQSDRLQLWAEARVRFLRDGVCWQQADKLARAVHDEYQMVDAWTPRIEHWLGQPGFGGTPAPCTQKFLTTLEILTGALGFEPRAVGRREEMRLSTAIRSLGYVRRRLQIEKKQSWGWAREDVA